MLIQSLLHDRWYHCYDSSAASPEVQWWRRFEPQYILDKSLSQWWRWTNRYYRLYFIVFLYNWPWATIAHVLSLKEKLWIPTFLAYIAAHRTVDHIIIGNFFTHLWQLLENFCFNLPIKLQESRKRNMSVKLDNTASHSSWTLIGQMKVEKISCQKLIKKFAKWQCWDMKSCKIPNFSKSHIQLSCALLTGVHRIFI